MDVFAGRGGMITYRLGGSRGRALEGFDPKLLSPLTGWVLSPRTQSGPSPDSSVVIRVQPVGAASVAGIAGGKPGPVVTYMKGGRVQGEGAEITSRSYSDLDYTALYPGIDLSYRITPEAVKYEYLVSPGSDPSVIRIRYSGQDSMRIAADGSLRLITGEGEFIDDRPVAYQLTGAGRSYVAVGYTIDDGAVGFELGEYDPSNALIIDPGLTGATLLGGSGEESVHHMAVSSLDGTVYATGRTMSAGFPTAVGSYDESIGGPQDAFVARFSSDLSELLAVTFLGGSQTDDAEELEIMTADGSVIVTGQTYSADFPATPAAHDVTLDGERDGYLARLDGGLTDLQYATFIGGSLKESGYSLVVGPGGDNVYVCGKTDSDDFPTTAGAFDEIPSTPDVFYDAFISRLPLDFSSLQYSTVLGGSGVDEAYSCDLSPGNSRIMVAGVTGGTFPVTTGAYDESRPGGWDGFVSSLTYDLATLDASTYLGGTNWDYAEKMAVSPFDGSVYVAGESASSDFPTMPGAYDVTWDAGYDGFVSRLDSSLTTLDASTFMGGSGDDYFLSMTISGIDGSTYLSGQSNSPNLPAGEGPFGVSAAGQYDGYFARLAADLSSVESSAYIGGSAGSDWANTIALNRSDGSVYVGGATKSSDFPTRPWGYDTSYAVTRDGWIVRLGGDHDVTASAVVAPASPNGANDWYTSQPVITLSGERTSAIQYQWDSTSAGGWGSYSTPISAPAGERQLNFKGVDEVGGVTQTVQSLLVKFDATVPTAPTSLGASHSTSAYSKDTTIEVTWPGVGVSGGASDGGSGVDGYSYSFSSGATDTPSASSNLASGATAVTSDALANGSWYFHIRARDSAGNWGSAAHAGPFRIDSTVPLVSIGSTAKGAGSYVRGTLSVPSTASDTGGSGLQGVFLYDGFTYKSSDTMAPYVPKVDTKKLVDGKHIFRVRSKDTAGNQSAYASRIYRVDNYKPRTYAPSRKTVRKGAKVRLYYKTKDKYTNHTFVTITIKKKSGRTVKTIKTGWKKPGYLRYYSYRAKLPRGSYRFYITAKDRAGNKQYKVAKNSLTVK